MLRLQAETVAALVDLAALSLDGPIQKVSSVKLDTGLRGEHLQHAPGGRFLHARCQAEFVSLLVQDPIVIVAVAEFELFIVVANMRADHGRLSKIERSSAHWPQLTDRNQS